MNFLLSLAQSIYPVFFPLFHSLSSNYLFSFHLFFHSLPSCSLSTVHTVPLFVTTFLFVPSFYSLILCSFFFCLLVLSFLSLFYPPPLSLESTSLHTFISSLFAHLFLNLLLAFFHSLTHPISICLSLYPSHPSSPPSLTPYSLFP